MQMCENLKRRSMSIICLSVVIALLLSALSHNYISASAEGEKLAAQQAFVSEMSVFTVSAANYEATVAPDSIAAAFGTRLASTVCVGTDVDPAPGIQLPTQLCGTSIEVNGRLAGLFFVSPGQVNLAIPQDTEVGERSVVVRAGDGTVSNGTVQVRAVAPSIFTANSDGRGVPAALVVRVRSNGEQLIESPFQCAQGCSTRPISLDLESEHVILVLFGSGIRHASDLNGDGNVSESVHVVIGGIEVVPSFAGRQGFFLGLDQINVELSRTLIGRGRVNVAIAGNGFDASNLCEIEIGSPSGSAPPLVLGFTPNPALASQTVAINGMGLVANPGEMLVRISGIEGRVLSASGSAASVQVPFGVRSGSVSVRTPLGEGTSSNVLAVRTSISGAIETTNRQPMGGVSVRVVGSNIFAQTATEGAFILPDAQTSSPLIEIDGTSTPAAPSFPRALLRTTVVANRDNQFSSPISLQQVTGDGLIVGSSSQTLTAISTSAPSSPDEVADSVQTGNVTLEVPSNVMARFTDGATTGTLALTLVRNSRMPVDFPAGLFSSAAVQITPFGVTLNPGGKLTFPNPDGFAGGSQVKLFRLDQTVGSPSIGTFIETGIATVSVDGQRIETAVNAVTETSYYFVAGPQPKTTIIGRVVDNDGVTPVRLAIVHARSQTSVTDGNGGFILRQVPVKAATDQITIEASYMRPSGRIDRTQRVGINVLVGGVTAVVPDLILPSESSNRPPVIIAAPSLVINASERRDFYFTAYDPDPGQTVQVGVAGAAFASIVQSIGNSYSLRLATGASDGGTLTLTLTATDSQGASSSHEVALRVNIASIGCGQTLLGRINTGAQQDSYTFSGNAGEIVRITAALNIHPVQSNLCPVTELYDPSSKLIKVNACSAARVADSGVVTLPATGKYVVLVRDSTLVNAGPYSLSLTFVTGQCGTVTGCGQTRTSSITAAAQQDTYTFTGNAGEIIRITAALNTNPVQSNLCPVTELYDPSSKLIKFIACSAARVADSGVVTLPATGKYVVLVRDSTLLNAGPYGLSLAFVTGQCGTTTSCGQTRTSSIAAAAQQDTYTFTGNAGEIIRITAALNIHPVQSNLCPVTELYDPAGTLIKANACSTTRVSDSDAVTLPATGKYVIAVRDSTLLNTGPYGLSLAFVTGQCGTTTSCGQTRTSSIAAAAQQDTYTFTGNAGEIIRITAALNTNPVQSNLCPVTELYDPTGKRIKLGECNSETRVTDSGPMTLPMSGSYLILVRDSMLLNTGPYALSRICIGQ